MESFLHYMRAIVSADCNAGLIWVRDAVCIECFHQGPSDGSWAALSTSKAFTWLADPAVSWQTAVRILRLSTAYISLGSLLDFCVPQDLSKNVQMTVLLRPTWHTVRGLACAAQQSYQLQRQGAFLPLPSGDLDSD